MHGYGTHTMQGTQRGDPSRLVARVVDAAKGTGVVNARNVANRYRRSSTDTTEMREDINDVI